MTGRREHEAMRTGARRRARRRWVGAGAGLLLAAGTGLATSGAAYGAPDEATTCLGLPVTIAGTVGDDVLVGTAGPDVIAGGVGDDVISGLGGDDVLCGGTGDDVLDGGAGDDRIDTGLGADRVSGGDGADTLTTGDTGTGSVVGDTGAGNDRVAVGKGVVDLSTGAGDDVVELLAFAGVGEVRTQSGNDAITGSGPPSGGPSSVVFFLGDGNDTSSLKHGRVHGGPGNDLIVYAAYAWGDDGDDTLTTRVRRLAGEFFDGGAGNDTMRDAKVIRGGPGDDVIQPGRLFAVDADGGPGNDIVYGTHSADLLHGGSGDDTLYGNGGTDRVYGDSGDDTLSPKGTDDPLLDGGAGRDRCHDVGTPTFVSCEVVYPRD